MLELLWLIPALPFSGFLLLALFGRRLSRRYVAVVGAGSVFLSMVVTLAACISFIMNTPAGNSYTLTLWTWMDIAGFSPAAALYLDPLSLTMTFVVTFVGFLIHLYSTEFMEQEEGYSRFFAYMNLFVGSMLLLVLADNLLFLYLGWEGVGLCSYLLIGFWYRDPANGLAARKAFVVTRIGDTALSIGLFLIFSNLGTLQIQELMQRAGQQWASGSGLAVAAAALLLGGAVGKSAQLPLQTWLPDAMAGPTPVSALIHAATMVTAGVYLIARTHVLFELAPVVMTATAAIGGLTLLISGFSALAQKDIKRVLAYSTISQIGYMFLALGVGAWTAAMFHFMTHAFFKALLFLGAGAVIMALDHEHDMFKMGGLRRSMPVTFWTFLIGAASLTALPLVTAGFFSKDLIISSALNSHAGGPLLWMAGTVGTFVTSLYTFRMVFLVFFGDMKTETVHEPDMRISIPLVVLAVLSLIAGYIETPATLGNVHLFSDFMSSSLPALHFSHHVTGSGILPEVIVAVIQLSGVLIAYLLFFRKPAHLERALDTIPGAALRKFLFSGWGFDRIYDTLVVRPFVWIAHLNRNDFTDLPFLGMVWCSRVANSLLSYSQTGRVRLYVSAIALGAVIILGVVVFS